MHLLGPLLLLVVFKDWLLQALRQSMTVLIITAFVFTVLGALSRGESLIVAAVLLPFLVISSVYSPSKPSGARLMTLRHFAGGDGYPTHFALVGKDGSVRPLLDSEVFLLERQLAMLLAGRGYPTTLADRPRWCRPLPKLRAPLLNRRERMST